MPTKVSRQSVKKSPAVETSAPIGVFDSGVGGLSVLRAIRQQLPNESLLYLADQAHVPYGPRPLDEVRTFAVAITQFLLSQNAKAIVVACNTASAAALHHLRQSFQDIPFVGMEPAVKPAAERTLSGVVGVLATPATFQGELYASVVERFGNHTILLQHTCPGLVSQIEAGQLDVDDTAAILREALLPMLEYGIDTVVLGCTHYPFVIPLIENIVGPKVRVIDPAPAVARQVGRLLAERGLSSPETSSGHLRFFTSGQEQNFLNLLPQLLGESGPVENVVWVQSAEGLRLEINSNGNRSVG